MSLLINANTEKVTANVPTLTDPFSFACRSRLASTTNNRNLAAIGPASSAADMLRVIYRVSDVFRVLVRGATNWTYDATMVQAPGVWYDIAFTFDSAAAANEKIDIYLATSGGPLAEMSYTARTDGNTRTSTAGSTIWWGSSNFNDAPLNGDIAFVALWNRKLTLNNFREYFQNPLRMGANCVEAHIFGLNGLGTQQDFSGHGVTGTVAAGVTLSNFPPMANPFELIHPSERAPYRSPLIFPLAAAGVITPNAALIRSAEKGLAGSIPGTGALVKSVGKAASGALIPSGSLLRAIASFVSGVVATSGALMNSAGKGAAGTLASAGGLAQACAKGLAGALAPSGGSAKDVSSSLGGSLTPTGALAAARAIFATFTGALAPIGALVRSTAKSAAGTLAPTGTAAKTANPVLRGVLVPIGALRKSVATFWSGVLGWLGQLGAIVTGAATPSAIEVTGIYEPSLEVTGCYQASLDVTGRHAPAIEVTGSLVLD